MLKLAYIGGLGMMAGPAADHLTPHGPARVVRYHDRGKPGEIRDRFRQWWKKHGAEPVADFDALVGDGDLDGAVVCAGKNGDDLPILAALASLLASRCSARPFIIHMSTVSPAFTEAAAAFCGEQGIDYANYPLTGGPLGAQLGGGDPKGMLILCSGDEALYQRVQPVLERLGHPRYFGSAIPAGAVTKLIGHHLVFNGLNGIGIGAAMHAEYFNQGRLGGQEQSDYLSFLNGGAGGTRQWELAVGKGVIDGVWDAGFYIRHAVVDAIYASQLALDLGMPRFALQPMIHTAFAFSYILMRYPGQNLATHAVVREMLRSEAEAIDEFMAGFDVFGADTQQVIANAIASLPMEVRDSVLIAPGVDDFKRAMGD